MRRLALTALVLMLLSSGCSSDDSTTDEAKESSSASTAPDSSVVANIADGTPDDVTDQVEQFIKQSDGDVCALFGEVKMIEEPMSVTSDEEANNRATALFTYLEALSEAAATEFPDSSEAVTNALENIKADYDSADSPVDGATGLRESASDDFEAIASGTAELVDKCGPP